jgi:hypothetical protein
MTEPAEHGIGERALVPRAVVAAAVDEEGRRDHHAAGARAALVGVDPRLRPPRGPFGAFGIIVHQAEVARDRPQVVLGQGLRARHQSDVRPPEPLRVRGALGELGRPPRDLAAGQRPMPEHVAQPLAELVAHLGELIVGRAAVGAGVAAVLDQRHLRTGRAEDVIVGLVDRPIEPVVQPWPRHADARARAELSSAGRVTSRCRCPRA